jgi:DNA-directed RNA polymerase subunit RPC12/RpoP
MSSTCPDCGVEIHGPSRTRDGHPEYVCPACGLRHVVEPDGVYIYAAAGDVRAMLDQAAAPAPVWFA